MRRRVTFSDDDLSHLHKQGHTVREMTEMLGHSQPTINRYLRKLKLKPNSNHRLTEAKIQNIIDLANQGLSPYEIVKLTGHNWKHVKQLLIKHNIKFKSRKYCLFTDAELKLIQEHYNVDMPAEEIANITNHDLDTVKHRAQKLGVTRKLRKVNDEEIHSLWKQGLTAKEIAKDLGFSDTPIFKSLNRQNLRPNIKSEIVLKGIAGEKAAEGFFADHDFEVTLRGNRITPYDFLVRKNSKDYAVNVRNHSSYLGVEPGNIESLKSFGIPVILWKNKEKWYWMEVTPF